MAVISKDLGAVTAYAAAVNRGYTGTKEEFETLMASYAYVAELAAESATNAGQSAQSASRFATDAQTAQGTAQQAATDAQTAQASAQESAQSAQQSAQSASQSAQSAESAKNTAVDAVDGFAAGAQQALDSVNQAGNNWKSLAEAQKLDSEAWAVGQRDGEDVGSSDPAYHNNAKYYAEQGGSSAQTATEAAQTATQKASEAQASASAAAESARTLTIDSTLTQSGQAADAKKTGDKITSLKSGLNEIRTDGTKNLFNDDVLKSITGVAYSEGVFSGKANVFSQFVLMKDTFEENQRYAASFYGKNTGSSASGNGLGLYITYTNGTTGVTYLPNSTTEFARYAIASAAGGTISSIKFYYNSGGDNVWEIKNIQIEKGASASDYVPYYTAFDRVSREIANGNTSAISAIHNIVIESSEISIDSSEELAEYPSFNNFPINKIVHIAGNYIPTDGPRGYVDIGHNNMNSGTYNALVLTYSAKTSSSAIGQICVFYNDNYTYDKKPRIATRYGRVVNGAIVWTEWSTMSENTVLHASDKVVDVNSYQTVTFGDFNDAQPNAIYQVDLNCGTTILNNPSPGHSGVLLTYSFSPIQKHALVQNHYALENGNLYLYIRYCYKQAQNDIRWTSWQKMAVNIDENAIISNKGELDKNTDINTVSRNTVYFLKTSGNYANSPFVNSAGFLTTYACDNLIYQRAEGLGGSRYVRYSFDEGSTWSAWT